MVAAQDIEKKTAIALKCLLKLYFPIGFISIYLRTLIKLKILEADDAKIEIAPSPNLRKLD